MDENETLIETSVDLRAKLEQVAEECGELTKACMKLIRAIGNGNPCNVSEEEAIEAVIEEMSDLEVAAGYLQMMLDERTDFDVRARMNAIADIKIKRWQGRIAEAQSDSCEGKDYCDIFSGF